MKGKPPVQRRRKTKPPHPLRSGYRMYQGTTDKEVTVEQIKAALPRGTELWDERDGTKSITVKKFPGAQAWQIRIIARGGQHLHMPSLFE